MRARWRYLLAATTRLLLVGCTLALVTGCGFIHPQKQSPLAAAATNSLAVVQQHHEASQKKLESAAQRQGDNITKAKEALPQYMDLWAAMDEANSDVWQVNSELKTETIDLAGVGKNVAAVTKENETLRQQVADLKSDSGFFHSLEGITIAGIAVLVIGFGLCFMDKTRPIGVVGMAIGGAAIVMSRVVQKVDSLWFPLGVVAVVLISAMMVFYVVMLFRKQIEKRKRAEQEAAEKAKALQQVVVGTTIATETIKQVSPPAAAMATLQLQATQDKATSDAVNAIKQALDPDMVRREVAKAAVVSQLPPVAPPNPASPVGLNPAPGEATVKAGDAQVTGPVVGSS